MDSMSATDFFDCVREASNCNFLSDLHDTNNAANVLRAIESIPAKWYTAAVWQEAVRYITMQNDVADTAQDCREQIILHLLRTIDHA